MKPPLKKLRYMVRRFLQLQREEYRVLTEKDKPSVQLAHLKETNMLRSYYAYWLSKFLLLPALISTLFLVWMFVTRPVSETRIAVELRVTAIALDSRVPVYLESNTKDGLLPNVITGPVSFTARLEGMRNTPAQQVLIRPLGGSTLNLKELVLPPGSDIGISKPIPNDLMIAVRSDSAMSVSGRIQLSSALLVTDRQDTLRADEQDGEQIPFELPFQRKFSDNRSFLINLSGVEQFEFPDFSATSIRFITSNATRELSRSSVISGSIRLLDTQEDPITLFAGDTLKLSLIDHAKVLLHVDRDLIVVRFEALVSEILAGPEILRDSSRLDRMPTRLRVSFDKYPYVWALMIGLLPILIGIIWPREPKQE